MDLNKTPRLLVMMFIQYFMQGADESPNDFGKNH